MATLRGKRYNARDPVPALSPPKRRIAMAEPTPPQEEPEPGVTFGSTVTILFSDIRGFTEFTESRGDEAAYRMLQQHNTLVQEQIALYGGHVVKTLGDSFMVSF